MGLPRPERLPRLAAIAAAALAAALVMGAPISTRAAPGAEWTELDPSAADLAGLRADGTSLVLDEHPLQNPAVFDGAPYGLATYPPASAGSGTAVLAAATGSGAMDVEVRTSPDGQAWSEWQAAGDAPYALSRDTQFVQARVLLSDDGTGASRIDGARLGFVAGQPDGAQTAAAADGNPTVRLWATREGMVGGLTANGHRIAAHDRFVALPSRKSLARNGGTEYQVRVSYNGRQATAPVWDIGPWNSRDDFWNAQADRDSFRDLPRFMPEVLAAWRDNYNGGRDQNGRWVTYPASIDLADGTFLDDLGMRASDWVDVTFMWVNAPSPSPLPSYPKVTPKAAPGAPPPAPNEPPAGERWYFAEGSTQPPFQTWLLLQNPNPAPARATLTYMLSDGTTRTQSLLLSPTSRQSVYANQVLPGQAFSTRVDSDRPILAERAMYFRRDGHDSPGAQRPETRWCSAAGDTRNGADTWLLIQNPGSATAHAVITYMFEGGGIARDPQDVPPTSRRSVYVNLRLPEASFAACVDADQPVIVERTTYLPGGGGNGGLASPRLSGTWYFAEGSTQSGAQTLLAIANPNSSEASVDVTYLVEGGTPVKRTVTVPPMGRTTVDASADVPGARFGMAIAASRPVVAERTMLFGPDGSGTHSTVGAPATSKTWYLAEGSTAQPFHEYVLVANPGPSAATVSADFMREDGTVVTRTYPLGPSGRLTIDANAEVPNAAISTRVRADQPVVVERSMYFNDMAGGTNAMGVTWDQ